MSKKTLNEATVRQFMKLVNHKPDTISNFISERYDEEKKDEGYYAGKKDPRKDKPTSQGGYSKYSATNPEPGPNPARPGDPGTDDGHRPMGECYNEELDEEMNEMAPVAEEEEDADPVGDEMPPMDDEPAGMKGEVDITPEQAEVLIELGEMLKSAMGDEMGDEPMDDEPADLPEPPPAGDDEEPAMMEAEEANEEMNEEEMIQEVARRVAARILKAKNAKKELDEALGNK